MGRGHQRSCACCEHQIERTSFHYLARESDHDCARDANRQEIGCDSRSDRVPQWPATLRLRFNAGLCGCLFVGCTASSSSDVSKPALSLARASFSFPWASSGRSLSCAFSTRRRGLAPPFFLPSLTLPYCRASRRNKNAPSTIKRTFGNQTSSSGCTSGFPRKVSPIITNKKYVM